jgi:hypothetical protein
VEGGERKGDEGSGVPGQRQQDGNEQPAILQCGGHVMTDHPGMGFADVFAAIIPTVDFNPTVHLNYAETVLPIKDGLLKLKDFPAEVGGSGEVMPE